MSAMGSLIGSGRLWLVIASNGVLRVAGGASSVLVGVYVADSAGRGFDVGAALVGVLAAIAFGAELVGAVPLGCCRRCGADAGVDDGRGAARGARDIPVWPHARGRRAGREPRTRGTRRGGGSPRVCLLTSPTPRRVTTRARVPRVDELL